MVGFVARTGSINRIRYQKEIFHFSWFTPKPNTRNLSICRSLSLSCVCAHTQYFNWQVDLCRVIRRLHKLTLREIPSLPINIVHEFIRNSLAAISRSRRLIFELLFFTIRMVNRTKMKRLTCVFIKMKIIEWNRETRKSKVKTIVFGAIVYLEALSLLWTDSSVAAVVVVAAAVAIHESRIFGAKRNKAARARTHKKHSNESVSCSSFNTLCRQSECMHRVKDDLNTFCWLPFITIATSVVCVFHSHHLSVALPRSALWPVEYTSYVGRIVT